MKIKPLAVIVSYHNFELLENAITSLASQTLEVDILIVDNSCNELIKAQISNLILNTSNSHAIFLQENLGFAGGANRGIDYALTSGYEFIGIFNDDLFLESKWFENTLLGIKNTADCGVAVGLMINANTGLIDNAGDELTIWGINQLRYHNGNPQLLENELNSNKLITGFCGGAVLFSRSMILEVGKFDPKFFAYCEDVDFYLRAQIAGWKILYVAEAICHHFVGTSSGKISGFAHFHLSRNMPWALIKNLPFSLLLQILPRYIGISTILNVGAALRGKGAGLRGSIHSISGLPKAMLYRFSNKRIVKRSNSYVRSLFLPDLPENIRKRIFK